MQLGFERGELVSSLHEKERESGIYFEDAANLCLVHERKLIRKLLGIYGQGMIVKVNEF